MTSTTIYDSDRTVQADDSLRDFDQPQKALTVTFKDLSIEVHGLGEDYGSTCLSVLADLLPFAKSQTSRRVRARLLTSAGKLMLTYAAYTSRCDGSGTAGGNGKPMGAIAMLLCSNISLSY